MRTSAEEEKHTTKEFLRSPNNPDIGWIPSLISEFRSTADTLSDEELKKIASPVPLSPLQQEFLSMYHKLFHLPSTHMLRLAKFGILPKHFLKFKNDLPLCVSCVFGQAHKKPWRHKCSSTKTGGSIRRDKCAKLGGNFFFCPGIRST